VVTGSQVKGSNGQAHKRVVAKYNYSDVDGTPLYQVVRYDPKEFRQRRPDGNGGWVWKLGDTRRVLYWLNRLQNVHKGAVVFLVEGEKDVDALWDINVPATTSAGGANGWRPEYAEQLRGRIVIIIPDNDAPGRAYAEAAAKSLVGVASSIRILELPVPEGGDVSDWLAVKGNDKVALLTLADRVPALGSTPSQNFTVSAAMEAVERVEWQPIIPLCEDFDVPSWPRGVLAPWHEAWVDATAEATQTPRDLAALISLPMYGAGWARKVRVQPRPGWTEPVNLFTAVALASGERKTAVFREAQAPIQQFEIDERARLAPEIARAASERRMLEGRMKQAESKAAKSTDNTERDKAGREAVELAEELSRHKDPAEPVLIIDDDTAESVGKCLAAQGGRLLQAGPEGTLFEICKGRYTDAPNFDVYLKAHAGDPLRTGRVGRERETVLNPALSVAVAVQPDVIRGLAETASMMTRGFAARFLYGVPKSMVGTRTVAAPAVPDAVAESYRMNMRSAWSSPPRAPGQPEHLLEFSPAADSVLQEFENWLEPQLASGQELSHLAGWANKLAGAVVRISGILHLADHANMINAITTPISAGVVERAVRLAREYLIPHARAAFGLMGADPTIEAARRLLACLTRHQDLVDFTRTELWRPVRHCFKKPEDLDQALALLVSANYLRCHTPERPKHHRGAWPPRFQVSPLWRNSLGTNCTNSTNGHSGGSVSAVSAYEREPGEEG
jgi:hypothetical protein